MYYAVIQRPEVDVSSLRAVSKKYDPHYDLVGPHVTLIFPVPAERVDETELRKYIAEVARNTKAFPVRFVNLELSWDQWLFLTPEAGRAELNTLHNELYAGLLHEFWVKA